MRAPSTLDKGQWPPDYVSVFAWRQAQVLKLRSAEDLQFGAREYYRRHPVEFINHWCNTYDPRNAGGPTPPRMPFVLFQRQQQLVQFLSECLKSQESGLVEKSRDMGATWVCASVSIWLWLFWPGSAIGWGSRKEALVDKIGDPDSIFEKMRIVLRGLPRELWPAGLKPDEHLTSMRFVNPETDATIIGEIGDNIGRGGRKLIYFKDEAQPLDTKILTPEGWRTMGDMRVGSQVMGPDGRARCVVGVKDCGAHHTYRVTFSDGTSTKCSPNHLWTVEQVWGKRQTKTLRTREIAARFAYRSPGGQTQFVYRIPICMPVEFRADDKPLPLDPYLVGALLGDGSVGDVPSRSPKITTVDAEMVEQFRRLLPEGCTITKEKGRITWRLGDAGGRRGWKWKSRARQAVVEAGIAGMRSGDKRVPERYLLGRPAVRLAVLQGLMDTDGSAANGGSASFHTCSPGLADDVRFLVQSLGGTATMNVKPDKRGHKDQYVLHLMTSGDIDLFRLSRKIAAHKRRKHPPGRTIIAVGLCAKEVVRCISVDGEDGLYLTDHLIVTHNSAHYERPEKIEAALSDNTRCQIDISSVNGVGNVFHRKREAGVEWQPDIVLPKGKTRVFVMDWRDHPAKTQDWYDQRRVQARDNGLLHVFAQEVDRDYSAAVEGVVIPPEWVKAAIDAHVKLKFDDSGGWCAALDVADEGLDTNALVKRKGVILKSCEEWGERDTGVTARRAVKSCEGLGLVELQYDCIGVGAGIKAETNRLVDEGLMPKTIRLVPWNAGAEVLNPDGHVVDGDQDSPLNRDFYANLKAQGWWELRRRFEKTWRAINEPGFTWKADELISLPSTLPLLRKIEKELSQPTAGQGARLKLLINKSPSGTRSPNLADAIMMAYWPNSEGAPMVISAEFAAAYVSASRRR